MRLAKKDPQELRAPSWDWPAKAAFCAISHEKHLFQAIFKTFFGRRPSKCRLFCMLQAWILEGGNKQTHLLFRPPPKGSQVEQLHVGRGEGNGAVQKQDETRSSMDHMIIYIAYLIA